MRWHTAGVYLAWSVPCLMLMAFLPTSVRAHPWGATWRPRMVEPESCIQPEVAPDHDYLLALFERLVEGNRTVFANDYAAENLCISVEDDDSPYARTRAEALAVRVSTALLDKTLHDDEAAAILAHELAHATLQHLEWDFEHPSYREDATWLAQRARVDELHAAIDVQDMATNYQRLAELTPAVLAEARALQPETLAILESSMASDEGAREAYANLLLATAASMGGSDAREYLTLRQWERQQQELTVEWLAAQRELAAIEDEILGEMNASRNWQEQEADEVAWEFLMRAGFAKDSLFRALLHTLKLSHEAREECLALIDAARTGQAYEVPPRGAKKHPQPCWRLFHAAITIPAAHPDACVEASRPGVEPQATELAP